MDTQYYRWMRKIGPGEEITTRDGTIIVNSGKRDAYLVIKTPKTGIHQEPQTYDIPTAE